MPPTLLFGLSFLPVRSKRNEWLLLTFEEKAIPALVPATTGTSLRNALPSVLSTSLVPLSVSVFRAGQNNHKIISLNV